MRTLNVMTTHPTVVGTLNGENVIYQFKVAINSLGLIMPFHPVKDFLSPRMSPLTCSDSSGLEIPAAKPQI